MYVEIFVGVLAAVAAGIYILIKKNKRERIDLHGKHVVVTGGTMGIGLDLSIEAFKQGAHVSIIARNRERLENARNELESLKKQNPTLNSQIVQIESLDISRDFDETKRAFERLANKAGPIDVLINNAGISKCAEFSEAKPSDFEELMRVNYLGGVYCTKSVVESMKSRKFGRIVFVSSQAGQIGIYGYTAYSATKFALRGLAEALQMELKPYNIYISVSYPPDTDTPGFKEELKDKCEETCLISESSGLYKSKDVALDILTTVKKGSYSSHFGINGFLLSSLTVGAGPATTFKEAVLQIISVPLCRLIAIVLGYNFDSIIKSSLKKKNKI